MAKRKTTSQFIAEAKAIHGNKYDYSKVEYIHSFSKVCIICPIHGEFWQLPFSHTSGVGCPNCYHTLFGVGLYDLPNDTQHLSARNKWKWMLSRCYNEKRLQIYPTYRDCYVCEEWLTFSNFKKWFEDPENGYQDGYHLDKDILVKGNREYSPNSCCFVPREINILFQSRKKPKNIPVGVRERRGRYESYFSSLGKQKFLGTFDTGKEAFYAYKKAKERYIQELAEKYFKEGKITERVYNALMNYQVEIGD